MWSGSGHDYRDYDYEYDYGHDDLILLIFFNLICVFIINVSIIYVMTKVHVTCLKVVFQFILRDLIIIVVNVWC